MKKVISWFYYRGSRTEKESLKVYYADNDEVAKFIEENEFFSNKYGKPLIPGITEIYKEGYTTKSINHGKLHLEFLEKYPDLRNKITKREIPFIDFFDSYYFNFSLSDINSLINYFPNTEKEDFKNLIQCNRCIKKELFVNPEFITAFDKFIKSQARSNSFKVNFSKILLACKSQDKNFFDYLNDTFESVKSLSEEISIIDQKAYLFTLNPGKVNLSTSFGTLLKSSNIAEWTGEKLIIDFEDIEADFSKIEIYPKENMIVKIVDEATFTEKTKLYF